MGKQGEVIHALRRQKQYRIIQVEIRPWGSMGEVWGDRTWKHLAVLSGYPSCCSSDSS
jgi:hypothetical protein